MVGLIDWSLLPVQLVHDFCHFLDISFVAHGSSSEAGDFSAVTVRERPSFTAESAFSFPGMPTWLEIQHKVMVFPCFVWIEYSLINFWLRTSGKCRNPLDSNSNSNSVTCLVHTLISTCDPDPSFLDPKSTQHHSFLGPSHAPNLAMLGSIVWLIENRYSHIHEIIDILYNLFNLAALKLRELEPEIILAHFIFAIFFFGSTSEISQFTLFVPWLFLIADERVGVQVKLWDPLISCAIPECFWGDVSRRGAISSVHTFTFICVFIHQVKIAKYREREHWVLQYSSTMCNSADTDY